MGLVLTLILVGIVLLLAELLLVPGVGVAGILGVLSLCGSSYYAFAFLGGIQGGIVTVVNIALLSILLYFALRAKTWKKLELDTVIDKKEEACAICPGDKGRTVTRLAPMGKARINDRSFEVGSCSTSTRSSISTSGSSSPSSSTSRTAKSMSAP